jgi:hypothetical protein
MAHGGHTKYTWRDGTKDVETRLSKLAIDGCIDDGAVVEGAESCKYAR